MISAISSFVREAFSERDGEVHEVTFGDHRFVMCNEAGLVVAVLVTTGETEAIVHRLRHLLTVLRDRYGERLAQWQGEPIEGIEDELEVLWEPYHLAPPPVTLRRHRAFPPMRLGQIFMGPKAAARGRTTSVAATIDGPFHGT